MTPQVFTALPQANSTTSFATGLTGAGPFTTFSSPITDGLDHTVALTSAANISAINLTIVGTNQRGEAVTEVHAGPNANTVNTVLQYKTITSITASSTLGANTLDVGHVGIGVSAPVPMDYKQNPCNIGLACVISTGASVTFKVQYSLSNPFDLLTPMVWFDHATITGKSANFDGSILTPIRALRLNLTAWTSGSVTMIALQGSSQ